MEETMLIRSARAAAVLLVAALAALLGACGAPGSTGPGDSGGGGGGPFRVGIVHSTTGPLASYGAQYIAGFRAGLDYATGGTRQVAGRPVEIAEADDAGDPAKAVAAATDLIGQGVKVIAGSTASGVALQVAPLAEQNKVLFVSGPAATDAITGANRYTFRSGRQTYQDVRTAGSIIGDPAGRKVLVFAQDSAFGQANGKAVTDVLGAAGAAVTPLLVPAGATDLTPFARQVADAAPDLLFVAWAGANATQMWQSLQQQGVFDRTTVVTGLDIAPTYPVFGPVAERIRFLSHFFPGAADNDAYRALDSGLRAQGTTVDLFTNDGFVAAQMIVHALQAGGDDPDAMVPALEGWSFTGPKGQSTIRAEDHALLQPMFTARLAPQGGGYVPQRVSVLAPDQVAPPVAPAK
jgi:branched-chain amino acid transport system substrate-binding protein